MVVPGSRCPEFRINTIIHNRLISLKKNFQHTPFSELYSNNFIVKVCKEPKDHPGKMKDHAGFFESI
jgi:hypothetical protein